MALPSAPIGSAGGSGTTFTVPKFTLGSSRRPAPSRRYTQPKVKLPPLGSQRGGSLGKVTLGGGARTDTNVPPPPKPRSLLQQLNPVGLASMAVQGVSELVKEGISLPYNIARAPVDVGQALLGRGDGSNVDWSGNWYEDALAINREYLPLPSALTEGVLNTVNVVGLGSQKNIIDRYQDASDEGRIVDAIIEDVGNASIVAGGVGAAFGRVAGAQALSGRALLDAGLRPRTLRTGAQGVRGRVSSLTTNRTAGTLGGRTGSLSASSRRNMLPMEAPYPRSIPLRVGAPTSSRRSLTLSKPELAAMRVQESALKPGTGLAGALQRRAYPGKTTGELVSGELTTPAALQAARAGEIARKVSLTAQYGDPADALLAVMGKTPRALNSVLRKTPGVGPTLANAAGGVGAAAGRTAAKSRSVQWAERQIQQQGEQGALRSDLQTGQTAMERPAKQVAVFVDENLKRAGVEPALRENLGGVILDSADQSLVDAARQWDDVPYNLRDDLLKKLNKDRLPGAEFTAERLDLYNQFKRGELDPNVTEIMAEGIDRVRRQEIARRQIQQATGNIRLEQSEMPTVDGVPWYDVSLERLEAALEAGEVDYPFLPSKVEPKLAALSGRVAEARTARRALDEPLERATKQLDLTTTYRNALPPPGTDVPWGDTLRGRSEIIDSKLARLDELEAEIDAAMESQKIDADLDARIDMLDRTIAELDAEIADLQRNADTAAAAMLENGAPVEPRIDVSNMDDGSTIQATAERMQADAHNSALARHDQVFADDPPNLTPPRGRRLADGSRMKRGDWDGAYDTLAADSPIWSNRRDRRWYTMQGWFSRGGNARGLTPDQWFSQVRARNPRMENWSDVDIANAYLDSVDRIYKTRSTKAFRDELVETLAVQLELRPELIDAALRGKKPLLQARRAEILSAVESLRNGFDELSAPERATFLDNMRTLDELGLDDAARKTAAIEMLSDALDIPEMELFGDLYDAMSADDLVNMLDTGAIPEAAWRDALAEIELSDTAKADAQQMIDDFAARKTGQDNDAIINRSLAEALEVEASTPASRTVGTKPETDGVWEDGTSNVGVEPRRLVVEGGPVDPQRRNPRSQAENLIEQDVLARQEYETVAREAWLADRKLAQAQARLAGFKDSLNQSQQDMLYKSSRRGVDDMQQAIRRINQSGRKVGRFEWTDTGGRVDGLVGDIAQRLGIYDELVRQTRTLTEAAEQSGRGMDRVNLAYNVLVEMADEIGGDVWRDARGELFQAAVADDLVRMLDTYYQDNMMGGHLAYDAYTRALNQLKNTNPEWYSQAEAFRSEVNAAYDNYVHRFRRELQASITRNMSYVPAPFRKPLLEARRYLSGMLEMADDYWSKGDAQGRDVAKTLNRMAEEGATSWEAYVQRSSEAPTHLISGSGARQGAAARVPGKNAPTEVSVARPLSNFEMTTGQRVHTLREYAALEAREMTTIARQQSVLAIANDPTFSKAARDVEGIFDDINAARAARDRGKPITFREFQRMLADRGYAVVKGATADSTPNNRGVVASIKANLDARLDKTMPDGDPLDLVAVTDPQTGNRLLVEAHTLDDLNRMPDVRVVPTYLADVINDYLNPSSGPVMQMYDQMTQLWKTGTLAWSVAWVTYNAVGNAIMATFSYGQSPATLVKNINTIRNELRTANISAGYGGKAPLRTAMMNDTLSAMLPPRMGAHGQSWAERMATQQLAQSDTRLGRALDYTSDAERSWMGKVTTFSYTLNEFTDNLFRTSVLMDDVSKRLPDMPPDLIDANGRVKRNLTPEQQARLTDVNAKAATALEESVRASLNTMGDFTRLSNFERRYVKRVFPFYQWIRHQTAMSFRIPLQNPMRWAWMQSLNDMLADDEDGDAMASLMSGMLETPFGTVPLRPANPLSYGLTAFGSDSDGASIFDPGSMLAAVNPLPKAAVELGFGIDVDQRASVSRPADQKSIGAFGQPEGKSAMQRVLSGEVLGGLGEIGYGTLGILPQTRGLRDMALGAIDNRPRYDSGDVIEYADPKQGGLLSQALRTGRMPFVPMDISRMVEVAEEKDRQAALEARRYQSRQAARSGG